MHALTGHKHGPRDTPGEACRDQLVLARNICRRTDCPCFFVVSHTTVNIIFREVCIIVVSQLEPLHMGIPRLHEFINHMQRFAASTGFPQGSGTLYGCHTQVFPPKERVSDYLNYKGWYSIILLDVVDHVYKVLFINVDSPERNHDAPGFDGSRLPSIFDSSLFKLGER